LAFEPPFGGRVGRANAGLQGRCPDKRIFYTETRGADTANEGENQDEEKLPKRVLFYKRLAG